ncbi:MAG: tRNA (N(6)-L-threonylcarbamoyladenosine(37)-C(2))-methylthiotransferase MtaB, partial [Thermodesulfobacteriota bacterium]
IKQRCAKMRELGKRKKMAFIKANINKKLEGLVLNQTDRTTGMLKAITSNYLTLFLKKQPDLKGNILDLKYDKCDDKTVITTEIS